MKSAFIILPGALDFRLIDREVIDHFNRFTERSRMTRALVDWLGFDRSFVNYKEKPRNKGTASYSLMKRVKLALNSFILHSLFPLKFAGYLGIIITLFSGILGFLAFLNQYRYGSISIHNGPVVHTVVRLCTAGTVKVIPRAIIAPTPIFWLLLLIYRPFLYYNARPAREQPVFFFSLYRVLPYSFFFTEYSPRNDP